HLSVAYCRVGCCFCCCNVNIVYVSFYVVPAITVICALSLHDALPIFGSRAWKPVRFKRCSASTSPFVVADTWTARRANRSSYWRSEEHTSELQSRENLVCRLLLEKKKISSIVPSNTPIVSA